MAHFVYGLCGLFSLVCAGLLLRNYVKRPSRFLLYGSTCFIGLALNNLLLFIDRIIVPDMDLTLHRSSIALVSALLFIWGFIWETR